ncbi:Oxidoreductase [Lachnellula willkommii]|uniref:Oxidoreductase n=1 Tax=Lachnellula willkommii TaxID=215461 RepID=A0A559M751_9HELO|nr:Oxidoreductase [Lachnellula willkommii]
MANILARAITIVFHFLTANYFRQIPDSTSEIRTMKHIVILGGSYAGVSTAHRILKHAAKTGPFKITLVSPNTHFYWNVASPRALIPGQLSDSEMFRSIAAGFARYFASQFEFVSGMAETLNVDAKTVGISSGHGEKVMLKYDYLILATGSNAKGGVPFKNLASTELTKDTLHEFQERIEKAETIVVGGAGATGVEFSGELAFEYGNRKEIVLISSTPAILPAAPSSVQKTAMKGLQNLKVNIKLSQKVLGSTPLPNNQTEVSLSTGEKLIADLYIPTVGLVPNSSYVPAKHLNAEGFVVVDEHFGVKGAQDVYAIGDVCNVEPLQFIYTDRQSTFLAKNFALILGGKPPLAYKLFFMRIVGVCVGRQFSTGSWGRVRMPNFVSLMIRKNLFLPSFEGTLNGTIGDSLV